MSAGRAQTAKALFSHITGIFTNAVIAENNDQFFIADAGYNASGDRVDAHKKVRNNDQNIRGCHVAQVDKDLFLVQAHVI